MSEKLKAPKLPDGYFFKVRIHDNGDVILTLHKRGLLFTKRLYQSSVTNDSSYYRESLAARVVSRMEIFAELLDRDLKRKDEEEEELKRRLDAATSLEGTYPPREYVTGGDA